MKAIEKKSAIISLGFEVKDFATKSNVTIQNGSTKKYYASIHSAYRSIVK